MKERGEALLGKKQKQPLLTNELAGVYCTWSRGILEPFDGWIGSVMGTASIHSRPNPSALFFDIMVTILVQNPNNDKVCDSC